ncbi:MAG: GFA family protein [Spartobacteria bacterium]
MSAAIEGGCLCGKTRYRLRERPERISNCHCIDCRRGSGAAVVTWGVVRPDEVEMLTGELRKVRHAERLRSFAACCGTPLFFQDNESSATIDVTIASLDHPEPYAPIVEIWTEDRLPWVQTDPTRKIYPQGR